MLRPRALLKVPQQMRSSEGVYFAGLDHIRAIAAFIVFVWHFNHVRDGHLFGPSPFPTSILTEGHIGVAIFMCLSGYLFAKLLDNQKIRYLPFMWNRVLRLFPLLIVVFVLFAWLRVSPDMLRSYLTSLAAGFVKPSWPSGGWSIAVELHFYVLLPFLLLLSAKSRVLILSIVLVAFLFRTVWWASEGSVQTLSYWTIVGGIDQFAMGIFAFSARRRITGRHGLASGLIVALAVYVAVFDSIGGFYSNQDYPSPSPVWVFHPTILAVVFAFLIAWYDTSFKFRVTGFSRFLTMIGSSSYSMYLLHSFVVFKAARYIDTQIIDLSNVYLMLFFATLTFLLFVPVAYLSYRIIECPPMRFRVRYKISAHLESPK
jgi:peptidoglycan/LPS O-acetylase OafA/YrhL